MNTTQSSNYYNAKTKHDYMYMTVHLGTNNWTFMFYV